MRTITVLAILLIVCPAFAADPKIQRDVAYTEPADAKRTLDLYAPDSGKDHPVAVWIHGGGWRNGDKAGVQQKPDAFVEKGFVFVSVNYRLVPHVTVQEQAGDIAKAIRWVHDHAKEFGGSADTIFVMGHSAGAHLAGLISTDDRYLKAEKLPLSAIKGCVPVDTAVYDVPKQVATVRGQRREMYTGVFGTPENQKECSPITHVAKGKNIPPFLILHVADRPDSRAQSQAFAKSLQDAGVEARVVPAEGKTHGTINRELGLLDDKPTKELFEFLQAVLKK